MSSIVDRCMEDEDDVLNILHGLADNRHRTPKSMLKDTALMYVKSILAGMCIALGGAMYLSVQNKVVGSLLFSFGLLTVIAFQLPLFTGKIGYLFHEKDVTPAKLIIMLIGNMMGTNLVSWIIIPTHFWITIDSKVDALVLDTLSCTWYSTLLSAVGCGIFMYIAVEASRTYNDIRGSLITIFAVMGFILTGCLHSIANMFYIYVCRSTEFIQSASMDFRPMCWVGLMVIGNAIGSQLASLLQCKKKPTFCTYGN